MKTYNQPQTDTLIVEHLMDGYQPSGDDPGKAAPARVTRARDLNV